MLLKETMQIMEKLLETTGVRKVTIEEAGDLVHINDDKPEESPSEYDITIKPNLTHRQIYEINEILAGFHNVEMCLTNEGLTIFEKEA